MTELPGLPDLGPEPAFAANDAAYAAVVGRASGRRRRKVAATVSATALAAVTFTALGTAGGYGNARIEPIDQVPTTSPTATASDAPAPGGTTPPGPHPTGPAGPTGHPEPSGTPHEPRGTGAPSPTTHGDPPVRGSEWSETITTLADPQPGEGCATLNLPEGWCLRWKGQDEVVSGQAATFTLELCRLPGGRAEPRLDLTHDEEVVVLLTGPDRDGDGAPDHMAKAVPVTKRPHSRTIDVGTCVRWVKSWNGLDSHGKAFSPGTYSLVTGLIGSSPRMPLPGEADQSDTLSHGYFGQIQVTS
jgi:hypothetical protein